MPAGKFPDEKSLSHFWLLFSPEVFRKCPELLVMSSSGIAAAEKVAH